MIVLVEVLPQRCRIDCHLEHGKIPACRPIVEQMFPLGPLLGERTFAHHTFAALVLDGKLPTPRRVAHHRAGAGSAAIGGKLHHGRLAAARQGGKPRPHRAAGRAYALAQSPRLAAATPPRLPQATCVLVQRPRCPSPFRLIPVAAIEPTKLHLMHKHGAAALPLRLKSAWKELHHAPSLRRRAADRRVNSASSEASTVVAPWASLMLPVRSPSSGTFPVLMARAI
ncbi:MAG: hypothetical protein ACT6Q1_21575 [Neoaquamicrobium sediminum]|uniref:hypothetical protein n=1 Tax=Neoaquamicrobium sediminum TaxID=1849104 RepID=UPI004035BCB4